MKIKYLFGACVLLGGLASCTSDEITPQGGTGGSIDAGQGAVVFSLEGLGAGSVETRATVLATAEENRIDSLDIYVFAYDDDGTFDEDVVNFDAAVIYKIQPTDAQTADSTKWYLQEKWTWKSPEPGRSSGVVDTSKPQLHEITQLGGSGVARTAVIYPEKGRFLKFFIIANGGELTATADETPFVPVFTSTDPAAPAVGTKASDFLNLRLRLTPKGAAAAQSLPVTCPLPMTAQMVTKAADVVNMSYVNANPQVTCAATLTRAVTRFDVVNYAALPAQGDYTLTDIYVSNCYRYINLLNLVPAGAAKEATVKQSLDGRTWSSYTDVATGERAMQLQSVFYTSPTLAGAGPMKLGLRGVLGKTTAQPGELLTPLNKDVHVTDADGNPIVLKANNRYVINIKKLGSDVNVVFSVIDWDSKILDADFSNAPLPKLISEDAQGITWSVADTDMNNHRVTMANTAVGGRLAFELGTYNEDELADLLADPANAARIPFAVEVLSLNDNPAYPTDNTWLAAPVITFDPIKRDRFNVVLDVRPEAEVPLYVRPDLLVRVYNKEHTEKQLFFRVVSTWTSPVQPGNTPVEVNGRPAETLGDYYVVPAAPAGATDVNATDSHDSFVANAPAGWSLPTKSLIATLGGIDFTRPIYDGAIIYKVTNVAFYQSFPTGKLFWLADEVEGDTTQAYYIVPDEGAKTVTLSKQPKNESYATARYVKPQ